MKIGALKEKIVRYLVLFWPKSQAQWIWVAVYAVGFALFIFPRLNNPAGHKLLAIIGAAFVAGAFIVPTAVIDLWEMLPTRVRMFAFAIMAYVFTASLGFFGEIRTVQGWYDLVFMFWKNHVPFSSPHTMGLLAAIPAWRVQRYSEDPKETGLDVEDESFIRGTPQVMSRDDAIEKLSGVLAKFGAD